MRAKERVDLQMAHCPIHRFQTISAHCALAAHDDMNGRIKIRVSTEEIYEPLFGVYQCVQTREGCRLHARWTLHSGLQIARAGPFSTNICIDDCQFLSLTNHRQITRSLDGASKPFIVKPQTQPLHRKKRASSFSLQDRIFTKAFPFFQNITRTRDCESKREKVKLKENSANEEFWYGLPRIEGPPGRRGLFT